MTKHFIKNTCISQRLTSLLACLLLILLVISEAAIAHGERSQEPTLRMRTIQWYDVSWSKDKIEVNDTVIVRGKFKISKNWPNAIAKPDVAFLNISIPGPVFVRTGSFVNGVNMVNSTRFELGRDYEWEVHLKARHPGRWHVHAMLNVEGAGPIIGPGQYVEVTGDHDDFINEISTITGEVINLDTYGLTNIISWHAFWAVFGFCWLAYWLRPPVLFRRYQAVKNGQGDELICKKDRIVAAIMLSLSITITFIGYQWAESQWPETIALQSASSPVEPLPQPEMAFVKTKLIKAIYRVPGRSMEMRIEVTNNTNHSIRLGEFNSATVRFINPNVGLVDDIAKKYPKHLLATHGLTVTGSPLIKPKQTVTLKIVAQDASWEVERLASLIYDPDSRFGGLLFFYNEFNTRYITEIGGTLSPRFI